MGCNFKNKPGKPCCGPPEDCAPCWVRVWDCGRWLPYAAVTVTRDSDDLVVATGTTDVTGAFTYSIPGGVTAPFNGTITVDASTAGCANPHGTTWTVAKKIGCGDSTTVQVWCRPLKITVKDCTGAKLAGAAVSVVRDSDGTTIASGTTDGDGVFTDWPTEDATPSATVTITPVDGCDVPGSTVLHPGGISRCGTYTFLAKCGAIPVVVGPIYGCYGMPLSGTVVSVAGPAGFSDSGATDVDGVWSFKPGPAGDYIVAVHDPSGRFDDVTYTTEISGACSGGEILKDFSLPVQAGYQCCGILDGHTPYPVSKTLVVTDTGGTFSTPNTDGASGCGIQTTVPRSMGNCQLSCLDVCYCSTGATSSYRPPQTTGSDTVPVSYNVAIGAGFIGGGQSLPAVGAFGRTSCAGASDCNHPSPPSTCCDDPDLTFINWTYRAGSYLGDHCTPNGPGNTAGGAGSLNYDVVSWVVNSYYPLNITVTFESGNGLYTGGPTALGSLPQLTGDVYSETITIEDGG